jgi:hypothetical protein
VRDYKQRYTGLAPATALYSTCPQGRSNRPTPNLDSDSHSGVEDLATLAYNSMSATPVVATPLSHTTSQYDAMPPLVDQSDDEDSDLDSDTDSGSDADTDLGDDASDAEVTMTLCPLLSSFQTMTTPTVTRT